MGWSSPIGIGKEAFWASLAPAAAASGGCSSLPTATTCRSPFGGQVADFDPKQYVRPRKSLKVMSRDIQLAFRGGRSWPAPTAASSERRIDPERLGVVFGADMMTCELEEMINAYRDCMVDGRFDFGRWGPAAMAEMFPLWMLKYLPNMPACHVGIAQDARGPNNTMVLGEVSSLAAVAEARPRHRARTGRRR